MATDFANRDPLPQEVTWGTVVSHHNGDGVPLDFNPHDMHSIQTQVDPERADAFTLSLGAITADLVRESEAELKRQNRVWDTKGKKPIDITREKAAAQMTILKQLLNRDARQDSLPTEEHKVAHSQAAVPVQAATPAQQPMRTLREAAGFGSRNQQQPTSTRPVVTPSIEAQPVATEPRVKLIFEVEQFGQIEMAYHAVMSENGFLILVYDTRYTAGSMYRPPSNRGESAPGLAAQVVGSKVAWLIQPTGIEFQHGHYAYCVLIIEKEMQLQE